MDTEEPPTAAPLTGGIRGADGSGVINTDDQLKSDLGDQLEPDLGAGSCAVQSAQGSQTGSQAGFSWERLEPSTATTNKRTWGVSVAFDNSKDRTFAAWEWSSSSQRTAPVTLGSVPAAPAGESLGTDVKASDQADEDLGISSGFQIVYGLQSDLTEDKVAQFAKAGANSPVSYVWKTQYTADNFSDSSRQATTNSSFLALVNPWPSENNECNPITVDWEGIQQHVIVPDEETKVGHIDVPALSDGSPDQDSLSRMVVEAYDGNGKYIASSDTNASNGGKQLLRIDGNGDIYYTWPEYRGTDLAAQQNVQFSVVAKPRTTGQLEEAHESSGWYGPEPKVFKSSNSLPRYEKSNEISRNTISLDDTEYHDPKYKKTEAAIISGVDSATGPLATEPQKVTFTQVPDKIAELVKTEGNGGFEAKVVLDERYVFEGWTAEMDDDYNVTVTAPENPKPGTFAQPRVVVEYSNGSTDELSLLVIVDPNNTQVTDLVRPDLSTGRVGNEITSQIALKPIMKGYKAVHPAQYEVDPATVPDGWTVTVDNTGKVTAIADDSIAPGTVITPKITATYPDGTDDPVEVQFQAIVDIKIPNYDTVTNKPNSDVTLTPEIPERGLSGNTSDQAPQRYTFKDENGPIEETELTITDSAGTWTLEIDQTTGVITTTIPDTAPEGHVLNVPVLAHYDGEKPQNVKGTIVVIKDDVALSYAVESTGPDKAVKHQIQGAPEGATFSLNLERNEDGDLVTEDGWKYTIDPDTGVVTSTPPADAKPGDKKTITVDVVTPGGATTKVPVTTVVKLTNSWEAEPSYPAETAYPGETVTSPLTLQKPKDVEVAKKNPYAIQPAEGYKATGNDNKFGNPTYTVTTENGDWIVGLDDKGNVVATAPETAKPGDAINVPVTVTYSDGSTDTVTAPIVVEDNPKRPIPFDVKYVYDDTIPAGKYEVVTRGKAGEEKQKRDGTWEQTTAPTNEVVHVGTKPATATNSVTIVQPIPYGTVLRVNPALAPGEIKEVQAGARGERVFKADFTATGAQSTSEGTSTVTKDPVERIVEYGPRLSDQQLVTTTIRKIPFETTIKFDDTLKAGEQLQEKAGIVGQETVTTKQKLVDGKPSGEPVVTTHTDVDKQDAVIRVGTKTEGQTTETVEAAVPFGVKVEFDPNMPVGTSETVTEGKPGKKTITVTQKVTNSKPDGEAAVVEKITEQPVDQVIKVGTKPSEASAQVKWTAPVPFEVETRPNSELKPGEIKVAQKGVPGEKTYTADFAAKGSDATVTPKEEQTKAPVKEIIEYGPRLDDQNLVTTVKKPVPFETEIVFDDSLDSGKQEVKQEGKLGEDTVTSTQKLVDGKPSGEPVVETKRTEDPVKQIIHVGTKTEGANTVEHTEPVPYETKIEYDPNLPAGTYEVVTPGKVGEKTVKVTQTIVNSQVTETKRDENVTTQPVTELIKVGTKQATATDKVEWTEPIPFSTVVRPNPDLKPGEVKTVQEGSNGQASYAATFEGTNGTAKVTEVKARTEPTDRIIEYGPTIDDQTLTSTTTNPVPFETKIILDPNLPAGQQVVDKQGENGVDTITSTQEIKDGKPVGEPTITTERTKEPVAAEIRIGTKVSGDVVAKYDAPVPFETQVEYDPTLAAGETKVTQDGKNGEKTVTVTQNVVNGKPEGDPKVEEKVTTEPTPRIVKVGIKPAENSEKAEWTVPIPYSTTLRPNPDLAPGETKVVQQGANGERTFTALFRSVGDESYVVESTDSKEPVEEIVEYGPRLGEDALVTETSNVIPFETEIIPDDTLPAGTQEIETQGFLGYERVTSTQKLVDGKPSGEPVVTTERTKDPVNAVIRVGTKTEGQTVNSYEAEIPFPVRVEYDPKMPAGESKVTQDGKPGKKTVTVTQPVVNSQPNGEATTTEEIVEEPVEQVITVGTRPAETSKPVSWTAQIPFETVVRPNPDLKPGEVKTVQKGEYGEKKFTAWFRAVGGESYVVPDEEITKQPKQQIIEYGPTIDDQTLTSTTTRPIQFKTNIIFDQNLPAGEQRVIQGENGEETVTSTQEIKDGKPVGEPKITTNVTKEPKDAEIRIGTKQPDPEPVDVLVDLPFTTKIVYDPTLEPGQEIEDVPGENGQVKVTVVGDKASVETVKQPVQRVVRVGTKPAENVEYTEELPFEVEVQEDPNLEAGKHEVIQTGVAGKVIHNADGTEERTEPVNHVIKVGTKCKACEAPKPSEPTTPPTSKPDQPTPPAPEDGSSAKAKATIDRCFGNAVRSPILWLLPIGILGAVGGKVLEPHMAAINQQFGQFNAEINRRVQQAMPDFGWGGHNRNNEQINQLMAQVDAANRQLQALAGDPNVQMIGKVIGAVAALAAISGVLYDWCSADVGQAKTAIDFDEGSSSRR